MKQKSNKFFFFFIISVFIISFFAFWSDSSQATISGVCSNCHTMHNCQSGDSVDPYGLDPWKGTGPFPSLTRGTCLGCHGMGEAQKIVTIGGCEIPQVYHTEEGLDLAAGNFAYILGAKGTTGASDAKGHNVIDIGNSDGVLDAAPGLMPVGGHPGIINDTFLTCAGYIGCHGNRSNDDDKKTTGIPMLKGAHHGNINGKCDTADTVANSYRFLLGVKGLENKGASKWQNAGPGDHNEYFGATTPMNVGCANNCHSADGVQPPNNTISGFCATCHGQFHDPTQTGGTSSPFIRHPSDIVLPDTGEYTGYKVYSVEAPVGRTLPVPDSVSSEVTPGSDVVTCLSCHAAHATDYPDMLRWDYDNMVAGGGGSGGCFICHTTKDD